MSEYTLPGKYHEFLTGFIFTVMQDKPEDLVQYAAEYFTKLKNNSEVADQYRTMSSNSNRKSSTGSVDDSDDEPFVPPITPRGRRQAVAAESYDPTKESDVEITSYPKTAEQLKSLEKSVKNILLFKTVDSKQRGVLLKSFFKRDVVAEELIIKQGDDGDNFYVIDSGKYNIFIEGEEERKLIASLDGKGSFGELALMYNCPRAATIIAASDGVVWCLDQKVFRAIVVTAAAKQRQQFEEILERVPMLAELTTYERMNLADSLDLQRFPDGKCIIREGDRAHQMYFIMEGKVKITVKTSKDKMDERTVAYAREGEYVGELALVLQKPRVASVYAEGSVTCAVLDIAAFERLLGSCVDIMKRNFDVYEKERKRLGIHSIQ
eukprot:gene17722-19494_t